MYESIGERLDDPAGFFYWLNHSILSLAVLKVAVETGLCTHLGDAPIAIDELAHRCGLPSDKLRRLLDFLADEDVVTLHPEGGVSGGARSRRVIELASMIMVQTRTAEAGPHLGAALKQGLPAYDVRFGMPVFEHLPGEAVMSTHFASFMGYLTRRVEEFVFASHAFRPFECAVDVGGSHGGLLIGLLARHPGSRGILFDLPGTTALVADGIRACAAGDRIEIVGGSFFESVPRGDLYLIKMVLHDWNDEECIAILRNVRKAVAPHGRVAVIDQLLPETHGTRGAHFMDVAMMIWSTGRERRRAEFEALFAASGFRLDRVTENPHGQSVIEAIPV
jgi:hypothetical protein